MSDPHVSPDNQLLLDELDDRSASLREDPESLMPWLLRPCRVRTLIVTDGGLDFSGQGFGLSTFVRSLIAEDRLFVRFEITVAHLRPDVTDAQVMVGTPGIARTIKGMRFDEPAHFTPTMYDQVWLFGFEQNFHNGWYPARSGNPRTYPADRLGDRELVNLSSFMNRGGGLFATGDHGYIGRSLCSAVTRARSMRRWASTSPDPQLDEVSMGGRRRNDTNRIGHDAGSQFDDQSDDVPQVIEPRLYTAWLSPFLRLRWPHPLLCGPRGTIRVLPDHPHEGECVLPSSLQETYAFDGTREYPDSLDGFGPIAPELVARSTVPGGNVSGTKTPTIGHTFAAICAYDGHRAGIGRVVCDATWHHFLNVNLIGTTTAPPGSVKRSGFLASRTGMMHLDAIRAYYRNIAVWMSPPALHACFRRKLLWLLLYHERALEAVLATPEVPLEKADATLLFEIGSHAREALGMSSTRCMSLQVVLALLGGGFAALLPELDPWAPEPADRSRPAVPFVDPAPLLDMALGGALLALREEFPVPSADARERVERAADEVVARGVSHAAKLGLESFGSTLEHFMKLGG